MRIGRLDWRWGLVSLAAFILTALTSLSLSLDSQQRHLLRTVERSGAFTLSRLINLDGTLGERVVVPLAFDYSFATRLLGHPSSGVSFGAVRRSTANALDPGGGISRVVLVEVSRQLSARLTGDVACDPALAYWSGSGSRPSTLRVGAKSYRVLEAPEGAMLDELARSSSLPSILVCTGVDWFTSPEVFAFPDQPDSGAAFRAVSDALRSVEGTDSYFGTAQIEARLVSDRLADGIRREFGWVERGKALVQVLQLCVMFVFGVFLAAARSRELQILRSIGSPITSILASHLRRGATSLAPSCILAITAAAWIGSTTDSSNAINAISEILLLLVLSLGIMTASFFLVGLLNLDSRLVVRTSATAGRLNVQLAGASIGAVVAVLGPFATLAWMASAEVSAVKRLDFGYEVSRLWTLRAVSRNAGSITEPSAAVVSEKLDRVGRVSMLCDEPWLDASESAFHGSATGQLIFASSGVASTLGLTLVGRDLELRDMSSGRASLTQAKSVAHQRHAEQMSTPVGRFSGFLSGASRPEQKNVVFMPFGAGECSLTPSIVLFAESANEAHEKARAIGSILPEFSLAPPVAVSTIIRQQQERLANLRDMSMAVLSIGLTLLGFACFAMSVAHVRFSRRTLGIRLALGEDALRSAIHTTSVSLPWIGAGSLVGWLLCSFLIRVADGVFSTADGEVLISFLAPLFVAGISTVAVIGTSLWMIRHLPVPSLLREE